MLRPLSTKTSNIDEEKIKPYIAEFEMAQKEDNVKNIALMGAYGSGKSTILMKLKEQNPTRYININMIEFSDEVSSSDLMQTSNKDEIISEELKQREKDAIISRDLKRKEKIESVEQSIIQQLIYQESQKNIPFSNMKKEYPTVLKVSINICILLLCILSSILFFSLNCFNYIVEFNNKTASSWLSLITFIVFVLTSIYLSFITIYYFYKNFRISKISFSKNATNFECERYESVYNRFLDELIYFFKETAYDTVIFEDIDRYNDLLFFSHLRELNSLLNNSKYLNKKIQFIYAIKDDLFANQDKHKFFDYIIPVVPVMDYTNSYNKMKEFLKDEEIEDNVLKSLSLYVSDMRTLINICNEFSFYKNINNIEILNNNSLLSIIVLKNLYPAEFAKLQYNTSIIDKIFNEKEIIINNLKNKNQALLEKYTQALKDKFYCLDPKYTILALIKEFITDNSSKFDLRGSFSISILNKDFNNLEDIMTSSFDWDVIKNLNSIQVKNTYYGGHPVSLDLPIDLKQRFYSLVDLYENQEEIKTFNKEFIMNEIDRLENELNEYSNMRASKLYSINQEKLDEILEIYREENNKVINSKFVSLVKMLILQDLLNESYSSYISFAYKDKESENDLQFIRNVYSNIENDFFLKLTNLEYIVTELKNKLHDNKYTFNYDVIKYLSNKNKRNLKILLSCNINKLELLYNNLDCNDNNFETIAQTMCAVSPEILKLISCENDNYKQSTWLKLILCLPHSVFKKFTLNEDVLNKISNYDLIKLSKATNQEIENLVNNVKSYNIKFTNLSGVEQNNTLYLALINNELFKFSYKNLVIKQKILNYEELSKNVALKEYINNNIEEYVKILIDNNITINQGSEFDMYINANIKDETLLCKYYEFNTVCIEDVSYIKSENLCIILSKNNDNILNLLKKSGLNEETKVKILYNSKKEFIKSNHTILFNYIKSNNLFKQDLLYKSFYETLMSCLTQQANKDYLMQNLLEILDENNLLRILKAYNEDFRKTKKSFILKYSELNSKIINKLKYFNLYDVVQESNGDYNLTKRDKPPTLIK